ncbi:hypothetical protein ACJW31_05G193900 [Castanea mollissima]
MELESLLALDQFDDVGFIGVWAMGGMGKFLKRMVYVPYKKKKLILKLLKENHLDYDDDHDLSSKIMTRLCHKRILLVLDDVNGPDGPNQLKLLARENNWFGRGIRIIITTRDKHLLKAHSVDKIYEVKPMGYKHALHLFCLKAFKKEYIPDEYLELSKEFLNYVDGLPLALEVLSLFLFGESTLEWKSALERLKGDPVRDVIKVLQISFDGLVNSEKEIFLHIACFFNHEKKYYVEEILDNLGLFPKIGIRELIDKSLLKISFNNELCMHNLLREMGRNEIWQESPNELGKCNRLWLYEDIDHVMKNNMDFEKLKFIDLAGSLNLIISLDFTGVPNLEKLVLALCSNLCQLHPSIGNLKKLILLDLKQCKELRCLPNFTWVSNLEKLVLAQCSNLRQLHPSIGNLKKLTLLDLEQCKELSFLPNKFEMESLKILNLSYCSKVKKVPEFLGDMKRLQKLFLECATITELPSSVECLTSLNILILRGCKNLQCLPNNICSLTLISNFDLYKCTKFEKLPKYLGNIVSLNELNLSGTTIKELPLSVESLIGLDLLNLKDCKNFVFLPSTICSLKSLSKIDLCGCSKFVNLPDNLGNLEGLRNLSLEGTAIEILKYLICLDLSGCSKIVYLPKDLGKMEGLVSLDLSGTSIKKLPFTILLKRLISVCFRGCQWPSFPFDLMRMLLCFCICVSILDLSDCHLLAIPNNIGCLYNLVALRLSGNDFVSLPESISHLFNLRSLNLDGKS